MAFWRRRSRDPDPLVCREFVELVTDYLEGALPATERVRFEAHLAECDGCESYLEGMRQTIGTLRTLREPPSLDPETRDALLQAFRELRGSAEPGG